MVLPALIVHCDWSKSPGKRWAAVGRLSAEGAYSVGRPAPVGDPATFFDRLRLIAPTGAIVAGFDFPIGIPRGYAEAAGIESFLEWLPHLGHGQWTEFYEPASTPKEVSRFRPFYPKGTGGTCQQHLVDGIGVQAIVDLLRKCEEPTLTGPRACVLFWVLGANQVGRAAIHGWRDLLIPAIVARKISVWPFAGSLSDLLEQGGITVAETYPAEIYGHLGLTPRFGKQSQEGRRNQSARIIDWCDLFHVTLDPLLKQDVERGFSERESDEDLFDALIGLLGSCCRTRFSCHCSNVFTV
jgi:hypothetical protein